MSIIREINGEGIQFAKAAKSHIDGKECLYVGQGSDGSVKLFESDSPEQVITTTPAKLITFARAVVGVNSASRADSSDRMDAPAAHARRGRSHIADMLNPEKRGHSFRGF